MAGENIGKCHVIWETEPPAERIAAALGVWLRSVMERSLDDGEDGDADGGLLPDQYR